MIPYSYNMVDMGGIDLAEANGTTVPGVYEKIVEAMNLCGDLILYNWKFADINIAPSAYTILQQANSILINGFIQVTELDQITIISLPPPIVPVEPLVADANGTYSAQPPASGFNPVTVAVPPPVIVPKTIEENGVYYISEGVDGFNPITVRVSNSTIISGMQSPLPSQGSNGQIYLQYVDFPSSYTPLESLSVTAAGPYIDTGVVNSASAYFEVESKWDSAPSNNSGIFGAQTSAEFSVNAWQGTAFIAAGSSHLNIADPLQRHTLTAKADALYIDGVIGSAPVNWRVATGRNYYLFANNYSGGSPLKSSNATVYHCRIFNGDTVVRDLFPAMRNSDSVIGMLDVVNNVFYENVGTGNFIGGQETTFEKTIIAAFCKVAGVWQPLIGTLIDDVIL